MTGTEFLLHCVLPFCVSFMLTTLLLRMIWPR